MRRSPGSELVIPQLFTLATGETRSLADFTGRIQHVEMQHGQRLDCHLPGRDAEALITSILVVVDTVERADADDPSPREHWGSWDYGDLEFQYNCRVYLRAPVIALSNRYHGLTKASALLERQRLLFDPTVGIHDFFDDGVFSCALPQPIDVVQQISMSMRHIPGVVKLRPFTVELQYLLRYSQTDLMEWKP